MNQGSINGYKKYFFSRMTIFSMLGVLHSSSLMGQKARRMGHGVSIIGNA
jgi:hypothetical protein